MKRRITIQDLQQLTPEQQEKLRKLWKPQEGDYYYDEKGLDTGAWLFNNYCSFRNNENPYIEDTEVGGQWYIKDCSPLLDIGQMIELIGCKLLKIDYDYVVNNYYVKTLNNGTVGKSELCDALWEAVKEVL